MFKAVINYFPVIPAMIGPLVFCLVPFDLPGVDKSGPAMGIVCP